ncbi:hypothetical protein GJ700_02950 [Duganella sp. FT92W]|uniref:Uncharacterized protein n=1 Tax=Pseudoduganella rivuli TaxID=2666085 RepID=A0A7X2IIY5_9BURK|nr:hypothetical protein [Pseudoduganella rivuli]MRV70676.1 hypothetical protein [Pseudoduganella rivuli]
MRIIDLIHQLLPAGTDAAYLVEAPTREILNRPGGARATFPSYSLCPVWPPDLFAVVGTIIERSGCYTEASPDRNRLSQHAAELAAMARTAASWQRMLERPPQAVRQLWHQLVSNYGMIPLAQVAEHPSVLRVLLHLFAIADEASAGMGWDRRARDGRHSELALNVLINAVDDPSIPNPFVLPYWPHSLCGMVSPDHVVVLPKSLTTTKGCTIRSLSHHLALLPCRTTLNPSWFLVSRKAAQRRANEIRLLLVPYPFFIPDDSFELTSSRTQLGNGTTHAAFFRLRQRWLEDAAGPTLSGTDLAELLVLPLIEQATAASGGLAPNGIVFPECALSEQVANELVKALAGTEIEFLITGVLAENARTGRSLNQAKMYALIEGEGALPREQNKHHRWRIDQTQADTYGLNFDTDPDNHQWWEDIHLTGRQLPFYAFRKDMSMVTLICEDLARMDPAMNAIRAVGPNLVVALLMDSPQLYFRWPGRYAGVLTDEPGCSVLSLTCLATVDRSNRYFKSTRRVVGLWSQPSIQGKAAAQEEIEVQPDHHGVLLTLKSSPFHQTTLDNRSDAYAARQLSLIGQQSLQVQI